MNSIIRTRVIASVVPHVFRGTERSNLIHARDCFGPHNGPRNDGVVASCLHTTGNTARSDI